MWKFLIVVAATILLAGCAEEIVGQRQTEKGRVIAVSYMPSNHGSGTGFSTSGHVSFTSVDIPEKWAVVFACQHGSFVIEGDKAKRMAGRLKQGDSVEIAYTTVYRRKNHDPGTDLPVAFEFVDATPETP